MAAIVFKQYGNFVNTKRFLNRNKDLNLEPIFNKYGKLGVQALSDATPVDSGLTAESWYYTVNKDDRGYSLGFYNENQNKGLEIVILLQYGHGTGTGGYIQGRDFINPSIQPIFDQITDALWREVTK